MKRYLLYLLIFILAIWGGIILKDNPGFVLIAIQHWTVEMPLWFACLSLLILFFMLMVVFQLFRGFGRLSRNIRRWSKKHRLRVAQKQTSQGLLQLSEGKWSKAEKLLVKAAANNESSLINYLAAARAAQEQGAYDRRDEYLKAAHESTPNSKIAVGLTQAQLQLSHKQFEYGLATLRHLQTLVPNHAFVLKLLKNVYVELEDWESLAELLEPLRKSNALAPEKFQTLEQKTYIALLQTIKETDGIDILERTWQQVPRALRRVPAVVMVYVKKLQYHQASDKAESILREVLKHQWDSQLVLLYGKVQSRDLGKQLDVAEHWLKQHGPSAALLLCLGMLCKGNQLWGKARHYLAQSLELEETPAAYFEYGELLEHLQETPGAIQAYRQGLSLALRPIVVRTPLIPYAEQG